MNQYQRYAKIARMREEGMTYKEIAEAEGISRARAKTLYEKYKDIVNEYGGPLNDWQATLRTTTRNVLHNLGVNTPDDLRRYLRESNVTGVEEAARAVSGLGVVGLTEAIELAGINPEDVFTKPDPDEMLKDLHPSIAHIFQYFKFDHLPEGLPRAVSGECYALAASLIGQQLEGPEFTVGLRKLLEAKDAFVRAALAKKD